MGALAREGFLPGYGLESGSVVGTAEPPRMTRGLDEFDLLQRPLTLALREYVPGNAIYANGFRFVPRRYQLTPEETLRLRIITEQQVVQEVGINEATTLGAQEIRAVPICDVILPSQSQISDEEEFRFQMSVAVYGNDRGNHRGGTAWTWEGLDLRFRRGVQLRLVNVGPRKEVANNRLGFPLCLACGQSHSPFASRKSREEFDKLHLERCGHVVQPTGFVADVEVDVLGLHAIEDRTTGFSVMEAVRVGASRVLDMEVEDLQLLAIGHIADDRCDVLLYDPMPGGSGLLEQLTARWSEVRVAAMEVLTHCPSACATSCIDCLQTYRNRFYHEYLDRRRAAEILGRGEEALVLLHAIPEHLPATQGTTGQAQTVIEHRFKRYLEEAGFTSPQCQHPIDLGPGFGGTIPDFFYAGADEEDRGVCIFLDGMSAHIHGNPAQAAKDQFLRERLRELGYEVVVVRSFELDDRNAVVAAIARIAKYLVGKEKQKAVRDDPSWFDRARDEIAAAAVVKMLRAVPCAANDDGAIPVYDLRIAAGGFSEGQLPSASYHARVDPPKTGAGLFLARIVGDSMDRVAPPGSLCLWQHLGAPGVPAASVGEDLLVRREERDDPELGGFTFKRLASDETGLRLVPMSTNRDHVAMAIGPALSAVARFVAVVEARGAVVEDADA
jgi:SOS-response transcriptional repressor LexA